jgi:hypothetical protein
LNNDENKYKLEKTKDSWKTDEFLDNNKQEDSKSNKKTDARTTRHVPNHQEFPCSNQQAKKIPKSPQSPPTTSAFSLHFLLQLQIKTAEQNQSSESFPLHTNFHAQSTS